MDCSVGFNFKDYCSVYVLKIFDFEKITERLTLKGETTLGFLDERFDW